MCARASFAAAILGLSACTAVRTYPVCNVKCEPAEADTRPECALSRQDFAGVSNFVRSEVGYRSSEVVEVAGTFVAISSTEPGHEALERHWLLFGCVTNPLPTVHRDGDDYARCVSSVQRWLHIYRASTVQETVFDAEFLNTCLNSPPPR